MWPRVTWINERREEEDEEGELGKEEDGRSRKRKGTAPRTSIEGEKARKGEAELVPRGQCHRGEAMGTRGVKACVVFSRPLEDVSRLASSICLTKGNHRGVDRMRDQPDSRRCVRVRLESKPYTHRRLSGFSFHLTRDSVYSNPSTLQGDTL